MIRLLFTVVLLFAAGWQLVLIIRTRQETAFLRSETQELLTSIERLVAVHPDHCYVQELQGTHTRIGLEYYLPAEKTFQVKQVRIVDGKPGRARVLAEIPASRAIRSGYLNIELPLDPKGRPTENGVLIISGPDFGLIELKAPAGFVTEKLWYRKNVLEELTSDSIQAFRDSRNSLFFEAPDSREFSSSQVLLLFELVYSLNSTKRVEHQEYFIVLEFQDHPSTSPPKNEVNREH